MFVLTLTSGEYSDATTDVVGVFDTLDAMVAAKEAHPDLSTCGWLACEIPVANVFYNPETPDYVNVLTTAEARAKSELKEAEDERRTRQLDFEARREREESVRRAEALDALRARSEEACARLRAICGTPDQRLFATAPTEVVDHLLGLLSDADLLARSSDPFHSARLPSLLRRLAYYAARRDGMRGKLTDGLDLDAFDQITGSALSLSGSASVRPGPGAGP